MFPFQDKITQNLTLKSRTTSILLTVVESCTIIYLPIQKWPHQAQDMQSWCLIQTLADGKSEKSKVYKLVKTNKVKL